MNRLIALLLSACLVLCGCASSVTSEVKLVEPVSYQYPETFDDMSDPELTESLEDSIYSSLLATFNSDEFVIDEVEMTYISKEYLEELAFNSQENIFFGYSLSDIIDYYGDTPYVFTIQDGQTVVKAFESYDDTWEQVATNVVTGTGVIAVCATITVLAPAVGAPAAVTAIFTFATGGAVTGAAIDATVSGVFSGIATAIKTGSVEDAVKAAALSASEGYKCGAIIGAVTGAGAEGIGLLRASKYAKASGEAGLTINEAATVQLESGYSLKTIRNMRNVDEYNVYKDAGLEEIVIKTPQGTRRVLAREVDLMRVDESGLTNVERMQKGLNPLDENGVSFEYHHVGQKNDGALALLSRSEHDTPGLHYAQDSEIERRLFDSERQEINIALAERYLLAAA